MFKRYKIISRTMDKKNRITSSEMGGYMRKVIKDSPLMLIIEKEICCFSNIK